MKILLTGATGFIGSHIAEELIIQGFKVVALKRSSSDLWRCKSFKHKILWIDCDNIFDAETEIIKCNPDILIHAAWSGVSASDRDNWIEQEKNLTFFVSLLEIVKKTNISKIIALGSQAEYGSFEGLIDETQPTNPNNAYCAIKVCASVLLRSFAELYKIDWYWIRIFSVFGEGEDSKWLIPAVISKLINNEPIQLTSCEQQYNYLYIEDFVSQLLSVVICKENKSGIYNLCNSESIVLKDLLITIAELMNVSKDLLKFNEIPQRPGQNMFISGDNKKFINSFILKGYEPVGLSSGLQRTIDYHKKTV